MVTTWGDVICALIILAGIAAATLGAGSAINASMSGRDGRGGKVTAIVGLSLIWLGLLL